MEFIKSFVIGSNIFIFAPFFYIVKYIPESKIDIVNYAIKTSFYFGIMATIATLLGRIFDINLWRRLFIINIISIIFIWIIITLYRSYNFDTKSRWVLQYILVVIGHSFAYLFIIYNLEKIFKIKDDIN